MWSRTILKNKNNQRETAKLFRCFGFLATTVSLFRLKNKMKQKNYSFTHIFLRAPARGLAGPCGRPHPPAPARFFIFGPRARPRPQEFSVLAPAPARARKILIFGPRARPRPRDF
jgi:hypothetical protein